MVMFMNFEIVSYLLDWLPVLVSFLFGLFYVFWNGKRYKDIGFQLFALRRDLNFFDSSRSEVVERASAEAAQFSVPPEQLDCSSDKVSESLFSDCSDDSLFFLLSDLYSEMKKRGLFDGKR